MTPAHAPTPEVRYCPPNKRGVVQDNKVADLPIFFFFTVIVIDHSDSRPAAKAAQIERVTENDIFEHRLNALKLFLHPALGTHWPSLKLFFRTKKKSGRFPRPSEHIAAILKMALCRGTAAPPTVTTTTNPEYHRGGVLPHGTNTARPQTSIGTPVGARGVTILPPPEKNFLDLELSWVRALPMENQQKPKPNR